MIGAPRFVRVFLCALMIAAMVPAVTAQAVVPPGDTYYVDVATGDNSNTGGATDPFKTIGYALEGAMAGDTIMVAPGHYSSSETTSSGEKFPLYVMPGVKLVSSGGKDVTILDADYRNTVIKVTDGHNGSTTDGDMPPIAMNPAIVDGFTVTRGAEEWGGGIWVGGGDAILRNLLISKNSGWVGGGVYVGGSLTTIENCTFEENGYAWWLLGGPPGEPGDVKVPLWSDVSVDFDPSEIPTPPMLPVDTNAGGGLYIEESYVDVKDCYFDTNAAEYFGGGIGANWAYLDIDNTDFHFNFAIGEDDFAGDPAAAKAALEARGEVFTDEDRPMGGGAIGVGQVELEIDNSTFELNFGEIGGAILAADTRELQNIKGCKFDSNMAIYGSAIMAASDAFWFDRDSEKGFAGDLDFIEPPELIEPPEMPAWGMTVDQSVFEDNWSIGGVVATAEASTTVQNCLFDNNLAYMATVMADMRFGEVPWIIREERSVETDDLPMPMSMSIINSTFTENISTLSVYAPWGYVGNSIFWNNEYEMDGPPWFPVREEEPEPRHMDVVADWVEYSNLEWGWDWWIDADDPWGEGNISEDPMFYWPDDREFWLVAGSPCIDTASDEVAPTYDLIDTDRPLDGDDDGDSRSDMGAYEYVFEGETRTGGGDRYGTSVATVREYFDSADTVVIARGDVFADGLAAAGLCGVYEAPLLLTQTNFLPDGIKAEIMRLGASKAFIMGGTGAVSASVAETIEGMGLEVERIGGATRYHTAAMIAEQIVSEVGTPTATFIARGDLFADALTVSPVAYGIKSPILLVRPEGLPDATIDVLDGFNPENIVITGGAGAVSEAVEDSIESLTTTADRIDGFDRYDTAIGFSDYAVTMGWAHWDTVGLATGKAFPDALTGGPALGAAHGVLLMTGPVELYDGVEVLLRDKADMIGRLDVLGGTGAISETVSNAAFAAVQ